MKAKRLFYFLPLLLALALGTMGCSSDDNEENDYDAYTRKVEKQTGVVHYDVSLDRWYITCFEVGSIDAVSYYYPMEFQEEFMKEGVTIVFSGDIYEIDFDVPMIAGAQYWYVDIFYITKKL